MMQPQHAVAAPGKLKVVGDDEGSEPVLSMKSLYQVKHHFCGPVVQIAGWLVGHQDRRSRNQGPGHSYSLLFASGQLSRPMMAATFQSDLAYPAGSFLHCRTVRDASHQERHGH